MRLDDNERFKEYEGGPSIELGLGPGSAGQSGDLQGLSDEEIGSESVIELLEEGQAFEAEAIDRDQEAEDSGVVEVHTRQVLEDDVPPEYIGAD